MATITHFPTITPLPLRDQADHVFYAVKALAANIAEAPRMLAGSFATNYRRGIKQGRINLVTSIEKLVLDAKANGKQEEVMVAMMTAIVDEGLRSAIHVLEQARAIA